MNNGKDCWDAGRVTSNKSSSASSNKLPPGSFFQMRHDVVRSSAFARLRGTAVKVLLYLLDSYDGTNNGRLFLAYRTIGMAPATLASAFRLLQETGFIRLTRQGGLGVVNLWRLTFLPVGKEPPTDEWKAGESESELVQNLNQCGVESEAATASESEPASVQNLNHIVDGKSDRKSESKYATGEILDFDSASEADSDSTKVNGLAAKGPLQPVKKPLPSPKVRRPPSSPVSPARTTAAAVPLPDDWKPNEEHRKWAFAKGRSGSWIDERVDEMRDWSKANGRRFVDWDARFREWLRKANEIESSKPKTMLGGGTA